MTSLPALVVLGAPLSCRRTLQQTFPEYRVVVLPRVIPAALACRFLPGGSKQKAGADDTRIALWCADEALPVPRNRGSCRSPAYLLTHRIWAAGDAGLSFGRNGWTRRLALSVAAFKLVPFPVDGDGCRDSHGRGDSRDCSGAAPALWKLVQRMTEAGYLRYDAPIEPEAAAFRRHWLDNARYAAAPGRPEEGFLAGLLLGIALTGWRRESRRSLWRALRREVELARVRAPSVREASVCREEFPVVRVARKALQQKNYAQAEAVGFALWEQGRSRLEAVRILAETTLQHFGFAEAARLARLGTLLSRGRRRIAFCMLWGRSALLARRPEEALAAFCFAFLRFGREVEFPYPGYERLLSELLGDVPWQRAMTTAAMFSRRLADLPLARSLMLSERFAEADAVMARRTFCRKKRRRQAILRAELAQCLGRNAEARARLVAELNRHPSPMAMNAALRLCLHEGDMAWGKRLWAQTERRGWSLNPLTEYHLLLGLGQIHKAFVRHGQAKYFHVLDHYPAVRMLDRLPVPAGGGKLLVLSECYPGDEVRFSRLYSRIAAQSDATETVFACDPRLRNLLSRSFPDLPFVPVDKRHNIACTTDPSPWLNLPGIDGCCYLDNRGWELAVNADYCITVMQALPWVIEDYASLKGLPLLKPDPHRRAEFLYRLAPYRNKLLVGLGWRSSLTRYNRNLWSVTLAELVPLFRLQHVQFVCCQYDGCTKEEKQLLETLPENSLLRLDMDQMQDIDGAAALYSCLDMMVTAPMFTSELAGALGVPMVVFSPVANASAFRVPGTDRHAFFEKALFAVGVKEQKELITLIEERMTQVCQQFLPETKPHFM